MSARVPSDAAEARPSLGSLDPIGLEILFNSLRSVADEMFAALMRSAYSTNIKERHDHSTAFYIDSQS